MRKITTENTPGEEFLEKTIERYLREQLYIGEDAAISPERYERLIYLAKLLLFSEISNRESMIQMVYHYGDMLDENDYLGRIIFNRMVKAIEVMQN